MDIIFYLLVCMAHLACGFWLGAIWGERNREKERAELRRIYDSGVAEVKADYHERMAALQVIDRAALRAIEQYLVH